jgi:branched-chain amino acid transport system permease protein
VTDLLQLLVSGVALGSIYALVCLGFVVIYRATGVLNFAQGGFVVWDLPFALAVALAMIVAALLGLGLERLVLRRMVGQPVFSIILITLGLLFIIEQATTAIWGYDVLLIGDPWGVRTSAFRGVSVRVADLWTVGAAAAVLTLFFFLFRRTTVGIAMRAAAYDAEAALAQGISSRTIHGLSWAICAAVAVVAGVLLAAGPRGVDPTLGLVAFRAFPAMILGGLDSAEGAVTGGLVVGVAEVLTAAYVVPNAPWLGANFHVVMPYVLMIGILVVRPYGLFGTAEVRRV